MTFKNWRTINKSGQTENAQKKNRESGNKSAITKKKN